MCLQKAPNQSATQTRRRSALNHPRNSLVIFCGGSDYLAKNASGEVAMTSQKALFCYALLVQLVYRCKCAPAPKSSKNHFLAGFAWEIHGKP
jgi:hypothetical protein